MARKLGLGWAMACCACAVLAGCQTGSGSRLAHKSGGSGGAFARNSSNPQPTPSAGGNYGGQRNVAPAGFNTSSGGAFPNGQNPPQIGQPSAGGMQQVPSMGPTNAAANFGQPAPGPGIGPIGNNPPTNVQITQPYIPSVPPPGTGPSAPPSMPPNFPQIAPAPQPGMMQPGLSPIQQVP